jgi:protoporphyrinogen oxidase
VAERCLDIPCAYVIYDHQHRDIVTTAREFLIEHDIHSIGRYGAWEYSGMEDAIWQGKLTAEQILQ